MIDHGISAAIKTAVRTFEIFSRRTGRTSAMIAAIRPGDRIITATQEEQRRIRRILKLAGKEDIEVSFSDPREDPLRRRGTNPNGATVFDHLYIEGWWLAAIERADRELRSAEAALSSAPPPPELISEVADRYLDWDRHGPF